MKKTKLIIISILLLLILTVGYLFLSRPNTSELKNIKNGQNSSLTDLSPSINNSSQSADIMLNDNIVPLEIVSPQNNATVTADSIIISGKTVPLANVIINEFELNADATGLFSQTIFMDEGENYFSIVAYTDSGVSEKELVVIREPVQ